MASSFDLSRVQAAARRLQPLKRAAMKELLRGAAKGFVKDMVELTPPAGKGVKGASAKAKGVRVIGGDLRQTVRPLTRSRVQALEKANPENLTLLQNSGEVVKHHLARRFKGTGRPRGGKPAVALASVVNAALKVLTERVGKLAGGWNAAAAKMGVKLAAWVSRHGARHGAATDQETSRGVRIELENSIPFVSGVKGYDKRVQTVLDYQANKMERQADFLLQKEIKKAGW